MANMVSDSKYKYIGFVGCYTKAGQADPFASQGGAPHDQSKIGSGVLAIGVDAAGKLSFLNDGEPIIPAKEVMNPSYLCVLERSKSNNNRPEALQRGGLCIVSEVDNGDNGNFHSYAVSNDQIEEGGMNIAVKAMGKELDTGGTYPCHIISAQVDDIECIIICNYGEDEGVLSIFGKDINSSYVSNVGIRFGAGSKVDMDRQEKSHAHSTSIMPTVFPGSAMDLCCVDLGSDVIVLYSINASVPDTSGNISLECKERGRLDAPPGSGPRSIMFNPIHGNIAIVSLEMTAQVWLIRRNTTDGSMEGVCDPISVLPDKWPEESAEEYKFNRGRWASDAVWSPDGKYAYAAARLHNSISVFELATSSESEEEIQGLNLVQQVSTEGLTPRCLCMSECGDFLLVAHQHSHDISSFRRNDDDGRLMFVDRLEVPLAACVKLVRPDQIG